MQHEWLVSHTKVGLGEEEQNEEWGFDDCQRWLGERGGGGGANDSEAY